MLSEIANWLEQNMGSCMYHKMFGIQCPGCGMQRAFIELLRGNFIESFKLYPPLLPIMFMMLLLLIHIVFKLKRGADYLKYSFIFTTLIIVANYIIKVINGNIY